MVRGEMLDMYFEIEINHFQSIRGPKDKYKKRPKAATFPNHEPRITNHEQHSEKMAGQAPHETNKLAFPSHFEYDKIVPVFLPVGKDSVLER